MLEVAPLDLTDLQQHTLAVIRQYVQSTGEQAFAPLDASASGRICYHLLAKGWLAKADPWDAREPRFVLRDRPQPAQADVEAARQEFRDRERAVIPRDLFERIEGYPDVKRALLRTLRLGVPVHHWLVGPPASGKTVFLEEIQERLPRARQIDGATATSRGIIRLILDQDPDQLLIDEADHLSIEAQDTLHSIASQGMARLTNAYEQIEQETAVQIVMTSNTTNGTKEALRSRFEIWRFPPYNRSEFARVGNSIIVYEGGPSGMGTFIAKRLWDMGGRDVRQIMRVATLCRSMSEVDAYLRSPHRAVR